MARDDYADFDRTRALQDNPKVRADNYATLTRWGPYNIVKVSDRRDLLKVGGYLTLLPAISGLTPLKMRDMLGLREVDLRHGAFIYRLLELPARDKFEVRGYTTLVDGAALRLELKSDAGGYRPGQGAYQITVGQNALKATLIRSLGPDEVFQPGPHPSLAKLYPDVPGGYRHQ